MVYDKLTKRETDVLTWAGKGKSAFETAIILGLSRRTVEWYYSQARMKLGVATTIQAVISALTAGYIKLVTISSLLDSSDLIHLYLN